jgi:hypothetical protein
MCDGAHSRLKHLLLQIRSAVLKPGQTLEIGVLEFELSGPSGGGAAPAKEAATTRGTQVLAPLAYYWHYGAYSSI